MKILSCHIENFGVLSNRDFAFKDGVNTVLEDNGRGKSTLAVFIKAMLFGLPKSTVRDIDDNERKKYLPWQGGAYGGYCEYEAEGRVYRVERYFGDTESQDSVRLLDMAAGRDSDRYDVMRLGQSIFGIDAAGFEKSVYYSQRTLKRDTKDDVYAKLTELMEEDSDMGSFGQADAALKQALAEFNKNNGNDLLSLAKAERDEALRNLENAKNRLAALTQKENEKKELDFLIHNCDAELQTARESLRLTGLRDRYHSYIAKENDFQSAAALLASYEKEFLGSIPSRTEVDGLSGKLEKLFGIESSVNELEQELSDQKNLFALYEKGGTPEQERLAEIARGFDYNPPAQSDLDKATALYGDINRLNHALSALSVKTEAVRQIPSKYALLFGILGFALLVAGLATLFFSQDAGLALLCVGAVSAGAAVAVHIAAGKKKQLRAQEEFNQKQTVLLAQRDGLSKKLDGFFAGYRLEAGDIPKTLMSLQQELGEYNKHREYVGRELERTGSAIDRLTNKLQEYQMLRGAMTAELQAYFDKKGIAYAAGLREGHKKLAARYNEYTIHKTLAADYKRKLDEAEKPALPEGFIPDDPQYDSEALSKKEKYLVAQKNSLSSALLKLENELRDLNKIVELIPEYEDTADRCAARLDQLNKDKVLLSKTRALLREAHDSLAEKYNGKLKEYFNRYASAILGSVVSLTLDAGFDYKIEERGGLRDEAHFSRGLRDLFDIAAHLALTDALFQGEKPFLLLDDPFKNLDDDKLARAKKMLSVLGGERQILYFVCHSSRT